MGALPLPAQTQVVPTEAVLKLVGVNVRTVFLVAAVPVTVMTPLAQAVDATLASVTAPTETPLQAEPLIALNVAMFSATVDFMPSPITAKPETRERTV